MVKIKFHFVLYLHVRYYDSIISTFQLPGLMEMLRECKSQRTYWIYMLCHLTGFMIGFVILLLIAIYEEELNTLVD